MEFLFQILFFAVVAIIGAAVKEDKNTDNAEKFDVKGLLSSVKEAFQDQEETTPPAKTAEGLMNESSWEKLTSAVEAFQDLGDPTPPEELAARLFDPDKTPDEDRDGEDHYFSADETGEGHVAQVGLSRERQLEQLKVLRQAGLIDEDEYKERKRKIKRG